jgi:uncharacterized membrane protein affecting hemolysin expression
MASIVATRFPIVARGAIIIDVLGAIYSEVGRALAENSNVVNIVAERLGLEYKKPAAEGERF